MLRFHNRLFGILIVVIAFACFACAEDGDNKDTGGHDHHDADSHMCHHFEEAGESLVLGDSVENAVEFSVRHATRTAALVTQGEDSFGALKVKMEKAGDLVIAVQNADVVISLEGENGKLEGRTENPKCSGVFGHRFAFDKVGTYPLTFKVSGKKDVSFKMLLEDAGEDHDHDHDHEHEH